MLEGGTQVGAEEKRRSSVVLEIIDRIQTYQERDDHWGNNETIAHGE